MLLMLLELLSNENANANVQTFNNAVSSKWIVQFCGPCLHPVTVVFAIRIFVQLWYHRFSLSEFEYKDGFAILGKLLAKYHNLTPMYMSLFALFFGKEYTTVPFNIHLDLACLLAIFKPDELKAKGIMCPDSFEILTHVLQSSTHFILSEYPLIESAGDLSGRNSIEFLQGIYIENDKIHMNLIQSDQYMMIAIENMSTLFKFLSAMFHQIDSVKEALVKQNVLDDLLEMMYQIVETCKISIEFKSLGIFDLSLALSQSANTPQSSTNTTPNQSQSKRKSFEWKKSTFGEKLISQVLDSLLDLIVTIISDSILGSWKPWTGLDCVLKSLPLISMEDYLVAQTWILSQVLIHLKKKLQARKGYFTDAKVLQGVYKFVELMVDRIYAGLYFEDPLIVFDFTLYLVESCHTMNESSLMGSSGLVYKSELQSIGFFKQMNRLLLFLFEKLMVISMSKEVETLYLKLLNHVKLFFDSRNTDLDFLKCVCFHIYSYLSDSCLVKREFAVQVILNSL